MTARFNANGQQALVLGTGAGDAPGKDFPPLCQIAPHFYGIGEIDVLDVIHTEVAYFSAGAAIVNCHRIVLNLYYSRMWEDICSS